MNILIFFTFTFSLVWGNPFDIIDSPGRLGSLDFNLCDPSTNAPSYCRNLYDYACRQQKTNNRHETLERQLNNVYWDSLPQDITYDTFSQTAANSLQAAEDSVFNISNVTRDEIRMALTNAKTALMQVVSDTNGEKWLSPLSGSTRNQMAAKIQNIGLRYGREYVEDLVRHSKRQQPNVSESVHRANAYNQYHSQCGGNGLDVNAFSTNDYIVLCPGLLISMSDHRTNKEQIKKALAFTFGHELGHAIDATKPEYTAGYNRMKQCYEQQSGRSNIWSNEVASEVSADYWGSYVLAQSLNQNNVEDRARTLALAMDGFCEETASPELRSAGLLRINQVIGRNPMLAEKLACPGAGNDPRAPFCDLRGLMPSGR